MLQQTRTDQRQQPAQGTQANSKSNDLIHSLSHLADLICVIAFHRPIYVLVSSGGHSHAG